MGKMFDALHPANGHANGSAGHGALATAPGTSLRR